MAGIVRQIIGNLSKSKKKGKEYVDELNRELSPEAIAKSLPETQEIKKENK